MAKLSFGVHGKTMDFTVEMNIADQDTPRILSYLASIPEYGKNKQPDGTTTDATMEEVAERFAAGILQGLLNMTLAHEKLQAAQVAADKIKPIEVL